MTVIELSQVLGNFGEFFGAIAVVATLIYLATQIRQNTKVARANMSKDLFLTSRSAIWDMAINPDLAKLHGQVRGLMDSGDPRLRNFLSSFFRLFEIAFTLHREGLLDDGIYQSYDAMIREYTTSPYFDAYWEQSRALFQPEFGSYVEEQREKMSSDSPSRVE